MRENTVTTTLKITISRNIPKAIGVILDREGRTTLDLSDNGFDFVGDSVTNLARDLASAIKRKNFSELILNDCDMSKEFAEAFFMELLRDNERLKKVKFAGINMPPFMALVNAMSRYPGLTHLSFGGSKKLEEVKLDNRIDNSGIYTITPLITDKTSCLVEVDFGVKKGLYNDLSVSNLSRSMISKNTSVVVKAYGFDAIFNEMKRNEQNLLEERARFEQAVDAKKKKAQTAAPALSAKPSLRERFKAFWGNVVKPREDKTREQALREQALRSKSASAPIPPSSSSPMPQPSAPPMPMPDFDPPEQYLCPITLEIMREPVTLQCSGRSYEKDAIVEHVTLAQRDGRQPMCPMTNILIPPEESFAVNFYLKRAIENYLEQQNQLREQQHQPKPSAPPLPSAPEPASPVSKAKKGPFRFDFLTPAFKPPLPSNSKPDDDNNEDKNEKTSPRSSTNRPS